MFLKLSDDTHSNTNIFELLYIISNDLQTVRVQSKYTNLDSSTITQYSNAINTPSADSLLNIYVNRKDENDVTVNLIDTAGVGSAFTITFNLNGYGVLTEYETTTLCGRISYLPIPVCTAKTFSHWKFQDDTIVTKDTIFTEDTIIYAVWQ